MKMLQYIILLFSMMFLCVCANTEEISNEPPPASGTILKQGTFSGLGSYTVSGSVNIQSLEDNTFILRVEDDFRTQGGPAIYFYLNNVSGALSSNRLRINERITSTRGSKNYEFSFPSGQTIDNYTYVIIWCEEVNGPFGEALLASP